MKTFEPKVPIQAVTRGPKAHFFGYYDKCPWDATGRYLLGLETTFINRPPTAADVAVIGLIDTKRGHEWRPVAETQAWNWQMGTRVHWWPDAPDRKIIFNKRLGDRFVAVIQDVFTGQTEVLPRPIYDVTRDGRAAYSLNFSRLADERPGYGYAGLADRGRNDSHPDHDGIWRIDLSTGREELIVPYGKMGRWQREPSMEGVKHWFNHILANPSGSRILFYHRWRHWVDGLASWLTRVITVNADGSDPFIVPNLGDASHYDWFDDSHLLIASHFPETKTWHHLLVTDRATEQRVLGKGILTENGHCSASPDRKWILTDTYPSESRWQTLILFRLVDEKRLDLGRFFSDPQIRGEIRCDLHPRWNRDGSQICFDSAHEGNRQMYVVQVGDLMA